MTMTKTLILLLLVLASLAVWKFRDAEEVRAFFRPRPEAVQPASPRGDDRAADARPVARPIPAPGLRKCRQGAAVTYTNGACPPGYQEQPVDGGTVTVVEGSRPAVALPALNLPDARALRGDPNEPTLSQRHIERATGH